MYFGLLIAWTVSTYTNSTATTNIISIFFLINILELCLFMSEFY